MFRQTNPSNAFAPHRTLAVPGLNIRACARIALALLNLFAFIQATSSPARAQHLMASWFKTTDPQAGNTPMLLFHGANGSYLNLIAPSVFYSTTGMSYGPDGNLYVCSYYNRQVLQINGATGAYIKVFSGTQGSPIGLAFGPDGNMYISYYDRNVIDRFNGSNGGYMGQFASGGGSGFYKGITFGPDGNLYVGDPSYGGVARYHGVSGGFMGVFAQGNIGTPAQPIFGPDGHLYVSGFGSHSIVRYNGSTGAFMGVFISGGDLVNPFGIAFGPDGNLYVADYGSHGILRYNGATGAAMPAPGNGGAYFVNPNDHGLGAATFVLFTKIAVKSLAIAPGQVPGGSNATGTVTLKAAVPTDVLVELSSDNPAATVPATVTVPANSMSANFTVTTGNVSSSTSCNLTARHGVGSAAAVIAIQPVRPQSVALNPDAVTGGTKSTATITLDANAGPGGVSVTLSSNNTGAASVPTSVTVAAGSSSATVDVTTNPVSADAGVTIRASANGGDASAVLTVSAPVLTGIALNPASVIGANNSTATVSISGPAPAGGTAIALSSSNTAVATVPTSVTVPEGSASANFTVTSKSVTQSTNVDISATLSGLTQKAVLTVLPAELSSLTVPATVIGSKSVQGKATLSGPAPPGGAVISLSNTNPAATVPASVTVAAGATTKTFTITTVAVSSATSGTITATYKGQSKSATLKVNPDSVKSLTLNPIRLVGAGSSTGTVTLQIPAAPGDIVVTLSSSDTTIASVPASITVPAGSSSIQFSVTTFGVAATRTATIKASAGGVSKSVKLTVDPH